MINRDLIRIKVVQLAYAYIQNGEKDLTKADKELELSLSKAYQLYNNLLLLICAVTKMARKRYDIITNLSKRDGRKVSRSSFIKNKFALQLSENADLRSYVENYGDPWEQKAEFVKNLLLEMQEDEAAISANRPVLLWTPIAGNTYTFKGVTVKTGEPIAEGGVNYEFVGTYAALITLKKGDYFIGNNKLWEADPDPEKPTTIKGTRAYLREKTPEARITDFRIGESESTGIVSIDNRVKSIDNATFDLQGRKVTNVKKGLYIKNSKKVVVR